MAYVGPVGYPYRHLLCFPFLVIHDFPIAHAMHYDSLGIFFSDRFNSRIALVDLCWGYTTWMQRALWTFRLIFFVSCCVLLYLSPPPFACIPVSLHLLLFSLIIERIGVDVAERLALLMGGCRLEGR